MHTIYRHNDGSAQMKKWKDPKNATAEELTPEWADIITYKEMDPVLCHQVQRMTAEQASQLLSHYIP